MQRRKFLIGMGSLAAGSAAAMGTGAFSFGQMDRGISAAFVADDQAYLQFINGKENSEYSQTSNGKIEFNFNSNDNASGHGLNVDSVYLFDDIARIYNHGSQEVDLSVPDTTSDGFWSTNFVPYVGDGDGASQGSRSSIWPKDGQTQEFDSKLNSRAGISSLSDLINTNPNSVTLGVGDGVKFGVALSATQSTGSKSTELTLRAVET